MLTRIVLRGGGGGGMYSKSMARKNYFLSSY